MIEWLQSDSAYWTIGIAIGVTGLLLLLRGVNGRRPRGKPTCWRCRYDMTGAAGLACPECGYAHRNAKQLLKTRRLWKRAVFGVMLMSLCAYLLGYPEVRHRRNDMRGLYERWYTAVVPTTLGILLLPYLNNDQLHLLDDRLKNCRRNSTSLGSSYDPPMSQIGDSFINSSRRTQIHLRWDFSDDPISLDHLWGWQQHLLAARCRAVAADPAELAQPKASTQLRLALFWLSKTGRDPSSGDVLLAALQAKDEAARYLAADALGRAGSDDDRFIDGLLEALRVTQAASRREEGVILHALARLRPGDPRIVAEIIAVFERDPTPHENEDLSEIMGDLGEAVLPDALRLLDQVAAKLDWLAAGGTWDDESDVAIARQYTLEAAIRRIGKPVVPALVKRLDSTSPSLRSLARGILTNMQSEARDALPRLRRLLDETQDPMEKELIAWAIECIEMEEKRALE